MGSMAMMNPGLFLVTWLVMMVAMMFPSVGPMTLALASVTRSRGEGLLSTAVFVLGYLLVWTAVGVIPLGALHLLDQLWMSAPSWLPRVGGAVIVVAGIQASNPGRHTYRPGNGSIFGVGRHFEVAP
jgi:predicted metal-binding membrane protein